MDRLPSASFSAPELRFSLPPSSSSSCCCFAFSCSSSAFCLFSLYVYFSPRSCDLPFFFFFFLIFFPTFFLQDLVEEVLPWRSQVGQGLRNDGRYCRFPLQSHLLEGRPPFLFFFLFLFFSFSLIPQPFFLSLFLSFFLRLPALPPAS